MQLTIDQAGKRRIMLTKPERKKLTSAVPVLYSLEHVTSDCRVRTAAQTINEVVIEIDTMGDVAAVREESPLPAPQPNPDGNGQQVEEIPFQIEDGTLEELLGMYVVLEKRRRRLDEDLKEVRLRLSAVSGPLVEQMAANGLQRVNKDQLTLYLRTQRFVNKREGVDMAKACELLVKWGWEYLVGDSYNASSLKSRICEMIDSEEPLPEGFEKSFNVYEQTVIGVRAE